MWYLSVFIVTWQQDACRDALQEPAHGFPWAEWACSTADHFLHQQLHRLEAEAESQKEERIVPFFILDTSLLKTCA